MNKTQAALKKTFAAIFCLVFIWICFISIFKSYVFMELSFPIILLGAMLVGVISLTVFLLGNGISFKIGSNRAEICLLILFFSVYISIQLIFANDFIVNLKDSWDFEIVASQAIELTLHRNVTAGQYFIMWPNNVPLLVLITSVFRFFHSLGVTDLNMLGAYINILFIDTAVLFIYLFVRKISKSRAAGFVSLVIAFLTIPYLLYSAIYYTDTLTLPFPIIALYLWQCAKDSFNSKKTLKAFILLTIAILLISLGSLLKITVCFAAIAILIDALIHLKLKKSILVLACVAVFFFGFYFAAKSLVFSADYLPENDEKYFIPNTHWIMMGLSGNGGYNDADYKLTLSVDGSERKEFISNEIKSRVKAYGTVGLLGHLVEKTEYVWGDGTYTTASKLDRDRTYYSSVDEYILSSGEKFAVGAYFEQAVFAFTLLGILAAGVITLLKKNDSVEKLFPLLLCIFGLFLFECFWEARTRYLFNYSPLFIVTAAIAYFEITNAVKFKKGS